MNTASGSAFNRAIALRVAKRPRASAGTHADGFCIENAATAARTSASIVASNWPAAGGAGPPIAVKRPGSVVSMPSKKLVSTVRLKPDTTDVAEAAFGSVVSGFSRTCGAAARRL